MFQHWFRRWANGRGKPSRPDHRRTGSRPRTSCRLGIEPLEERALLSASLVQDIIPGLTTSNPTNLTDVNGTLFFVADDGVHGRELWRSDGTPEGTVLVKDINPGGASSSPADLTNVNGTLFFTVDDGIHGRELWKSDGTAKGTVLVQDINPGSAGSHLNNLTDVHGMLFFTSRMPGMVEALWKSDGTADGTVPIFRSFSSLANLTNVNGTLFFTSFLSFDFATGVFIPPDITSRVYSYENAQLWKSDGTADGTVLVRDISTGDYTRGYFGLGALEYSPFGGLVALDGTLFFTFNRAGTSAELWKSDGTADGTVLVKVIPPLAVTNSRLLRIPYNPPPQVGSPVAVGGTLFFTAHTPETGTELWRSDGTAEGTVPVRLIHPGGFEVETDADDPSCLILSSGIICSQHAARISFYPTELTAVNGTLFFVTFDPTNGTELWKSDGTAAGTVLVKDIKPGSAGSFPTNLTAVNGVLYFTANDGRHGRELWRSDGTAKGTVLVQDIHPGRGGSNPANLTAVNGVLYFTADDGGTGIELWKAKDERPPLPPSDPAIPLSPPAEKNPKGILPVPYQAVLGALLDCAGVPTPIPENPVVLLSDPAIALAWADVSTSPVDPYRRPLNGHREKQRSLK